MMQITMTSNDKIVRFAIDATSEDALSNQLGGLGKKFIPTHLMIRFKLDRPGEWSADITGKALTASGAPAKKARGYMWTSHRRFNDTPDWILDLVTKHMPTPGAI